MKSFGIPEMAIVRLSKEDVIATSLCEANICGNYQCDDCVECVGTFTCWSVICPEYQG